MHSLYMICSIFHVVQPSTWKMFLHSWRNCYIFPFFLSFWAHFSMYFLVEEVNITHKLLYYMCWIIRKEAWQTNSIMVWKEVDYQILCFLLGSLGLHESKLKNYPFLRIMIAFNILTNEIWLQIKMISSIYHFCIFTIGLWSHTKSIWAFGYRLAPCGERATSMRKICCELIIHLLCLVDLGMTNLRFLWALKKNLCSQLVFPKYIIHVWRYLKTWHGGQ